MSILDRLFNRGLSKREREKLELEARARSEQHEKLVSRRQQSASKRAFNAALIDRLRQNLTSSVVSANYEIREASEALRARARHHANNNEYAKKYLAMCETNIVGAKGFSLQVYSYGLDGKLDAADNSRTEEAFKKWAKRGSCEITGRYGFAELKRVLVKSVARDGEALVRKITGKAAKNGYFALQFIDIDRLDIELNDQTKNGNLIVMGIEVNTWGMPVAYYIKTGNTNGTGQYVHNTALNRKYERIPADEIYHLYMSDRPEQYRGITWMHAGLDTLNHLSAFTEAVIVAARTGASKMAFIQQTGSNDPEELADDVDPLGNMVTDIQPGTIGILPAGFEMKQYDPAFIDSAVGPFIKTFVQRLSSAFQVSYPELASDLEGVSYSSIRSGTLSERGMFESKQEWFIDAFLQPLFSDWLKAALDAGVLVNDNGTPIPPERFEKLNAASWKGRRWDWVDPQSEVDASIKAIQNGLKTRRDIVSNQGHDVMETMDQLKLEQDYYEQLGLVLEIPKTAVAPQVPAQDEEKARGAEVATAIAGLATAVASREASAPVVNITNNPRSVRKIPVRDPNTGLIVEVKEEEVEESDASE